MDTIHKVSMYYNAEAAKTVKFDNFNDIYTDDRVIMSDEDRNAPMFSSLTTPFEGF